MTMQFGGGGTSTFVTAPTAGKPTLQVGTGTFNGGAAPDFQGTSVLGINMASGYTHSLFSAQVAGVARATIDIGGQLQLVGTGTLNYRMLSLQGLGPGTSGIQVIYPGGGSADYFGLTASSVQMSITNRTLQLGVTGNALDSSALQSVAIKSSNAGIAQLAVVGTASQTGDLITVKDSTPTNHFAVANIGTGAAPIWCLRVAPTANTASMAQAHTAGANTGRGIQVIDNTGTSLGWLNLTA